MKSPWGTPKLPEIPPKWLHSACPIVLIEPTVSYSSSYSLWLLHCHWGPNRGLKTAIKLDKANCSIIRTGCLGAAAGVAMALDVLYAHPQLS